MIKYLNVLLLLLALIPLLSYASNAELSEDLKSIEKISMVKDELETTAEFGTRVNELYARYRDKKYELSIDINAPLFSEHKYLKYNPDTSVLTVSLPKLDNKLLWVEKNGARNIKFIYFSFIQTEESDIKTSQYVARNGLGKRSLSQKLTV